MKNGSQKLGGKMTGRPKRKFTWGQCMKYEVNPEEVMFKSAVLPKSCTDPNVKGTPIQEFYAGSNVLITGGTGFMGKILVEKLLVSCPKLKKIYLIIREKKGQSMEKRFDTLFQDTVFSRLREMVPDFRKKLVAVNGDCSQIRLGLSDEDYESLTENVNIIIHGAATVRFDEKIRTAAHINVRGVREILQLAHKCSKLKSIVHISTAYSNCLPNGNVVNEAFFPPAYNYEDLLKLVEEESEEKLAKMTSQIVAPRPNTYAFTKHLAEEVAHVEGDGLPLAIFRPAIVVASNQEPIRNWTDNIYGPTGVCVGAGTGVLRVICGNGHFEANIVPVDLAVNGVLAAAWKAEKDFLAKNGTKIYNYVSTTRNPITWDEFSYWTAAYGRKNAKTVKAVWYPFCLVISNPFLYMILSFLLHTIPAYLADTVLFLTGQQTMLVKGYRKISKFLEVIKYFNLNEWYFPDENTKALCNSLSQQDKDIYPCDIEDLDWDAYNHTHLLGLRIHLAKDPIDTLPAGRVKYKWLLVQHLIVCGLLGFFLLRLVLNLVGWSLF